MIFYPAVTSDINKNVKNNFLLDDENESLNENPNYYAIVIGIEFLQNFEMRSNNASKLAFDLYQSLLKGDNWNKDNIPFASKDPNPARD